MNACKLKSAENLPNVNICKLELNDNQIPGADLKILAQKYKTLVSLKLGANKVATLEEVKALAGLETLVKLDLFDNPVCKVEGYRAEVYKMIPQLIILDG